MPQVIFQEVLIVFTLKIVCFFIFLDCFSYLINFPIYPAKLHVLEHLSQCSSTLHRSSHQDQCSSAQVAISCFQRRFVPQESSLSYIQCHFQSCHRSSTNPTSIGPSAYKRPSYVPFLHLSPIELLSVFRVSSLRLPMVCLCPIRIFYFIILFKAIIQLSSEYFQRFSFPRYFSCFCAFLL